MTIGGALLQEFDQEMKMTRSMIELVTDSIADWRPHEKSWTSGELALHLASILKWAKITLESAEFDVNPKDGERPPSPVYESQSTTLAYFDANAADARKAIEAASDAEMVVAWSLKSGGTTVFTMPRVAVLRAFVMNHLIHHRGQLSVYLRMQDVLLPEIYGRTADSP